MLCIIRTLIASERLLNFINVVIGYGFSVFLEGICGFGSPVAILARFWLV